MKKKRNELPDFSDVREWHIGRALESMVALASIGMQLHLDEVIYCLEIESRTQRRKSIITTLIRHAARLKKEEYIEQLNKQYFQSHERK